MKVCIIVLNNSNNKNNYKRKLKQISELIHRIAV